MLPQTNVPLDDPRVVAFLDQHFSGRTVLKIPRIESREPGQCYLNVRTVADAQGGAMQLGWLLAWYPEHLIEALHHAVWKRSDGSLVEVTGPAYPNMRGPTIDFIPDGDAVTSLDDPAVPSIFEQLDGKKGTREYIELSRQRVEKIGEFNRLLSPFKDRAGRFAVAPNDPVVPRVHALQHDIATLDARRQYYGRRFIAGNFD